MNTEHCLNLLRSNVKQTDHPHSDFAQVDRTAEDETPGQSPVIFVLAEECTVCSMEAQEVGGHPGI